MKVESNLIIITKEETYMSKTDLKLKNIFILD